MDSQNVRYKTDFSSPFANIPGIAIYDPRPAIDGEMSVGQIRQKKPMISKASVFDGLVDGIGYPEKYFLLCISLSCRSH
jgi:hypothetical protein